MRELFAFDAPESAGERIHFKAFELFIVAYCVYWGWEWGLYMPQIGAAVRPLGIAEYVDISFVFARWAGVANALLISLACGLGFFRIAPRFGYTLALLAFHLHFVARHALGDICHASNFVGMGLLALCAAAYVFEESRQRRRFAPGTTVFFLGLAYSSAAISKFIGTGLDWADGRHLWLWVGEKVVDAYSKFGVLRVNAFQELVLQHRALASLVLTLGITTEALGFLLWFRRTRPYVALACVALHLGIYVSMNIMFDMFIYQLLLVGLPWARWIDLALVRREPAWLMRIGDASARFA